MKLPTTNFNLSGNLFRQRNNLSFATWAQQIQDVQFADKVGDGGWHLYNWRTSEEVGFSQDNDINKPDSTGFYSYPLLIREVEDRFMVVSIHSSVIQAFINRKRLARQIEKPDINISSIVQNSVFPSDVEGQSKGNAFRLAAVYAHVDGFGLSLQKISLFGEDICNANLIKDILKYLNPYRVTLRDIRASSEILSIGSTGEISFYYKGPISLDKVDRAMAFIRRGNYIQWRMKSR